MRIAIKTIIFVGAFSSLCVSAFAQNNKTAIKPWFQALSPVDREVISELLADDAQIELKDYDITQSKEEFVEALDNWEEAIESGSIAFKIDEDASSEENITTKVCYKFSSNELMTVETFEFNEGMIIKSVQETIADDCAEF
jgi:hypothetical protein